MFYFLIQKTDARSVLEATATFNVTTGSNSTESLSVYGDSVVFVNRML